MGFLVIFVSWFVGIWGWAQIIGSIQHAQIRGAARTLITILIWTCILGGGAYLGIAKFGYKVPVIIGYGVSFVMIITRGRIE